MEDPKKVLPPPPEPPTITEIKSRKEFVNPAQQNPEYRARPRPTPGKGGKPGHRKQKTKDALKSQAAKMSGDMLRILERIARSNKAKASERITAATKILEYGVGKPTNVVGQDPDMPFNHEELAKMPMVDLEARVKAALLAEAHDDHDQQDPPVQ